MLHFNRSGLLIPDLNIASDFNELQSEFVDNIPTPERLAHFNAYTKYSNALKELCGNIDLIQWIDGSFVTKAPKPKDIDVVTFINVQILSTLGNAMKSF